MEENNFFNMGPMYFNPVGVHNWKIKKSDCHEKRITIHDFLDMQKGRPGFVVGAGPSLHFQDTDVLKGYPVFAVNSALPKVPFALYFVADDKGVQKWSYYTELLPTLNCISFLYHAKLKGTTTHLDNNKVMWFTHKTWYEPSKKKYHEDGLVLTKDPSLPIIGARTSSGTAVHLAHIMGCSPIVLLGCDCCYSKDNKRYYWQYWPKEKQPYRITGEPVFSTPNHGKKNGKPVDAHCDAFVEYWNALAKQAKKQNITIIDASDGLLDCFPKMKLADILDKYGQEKNNQTS